MHIYASLLHCSFHCILSVVFLVGFSLSITMHPCAELSSFRILGTHFLGIMELTKKDTKIFLVLLMMNDLDDPSDDTEDWIFLISLFLNSTPPQPQFQFNMDNLSDEQCVEQFRFRQHHIFEIIPVLQLPDIIQCSNGTICSSLEAFLILCHRLAYPNWWCDLEPLFHRPPPELSVFNTILLTIYMDWNFLLSGQNVCLTLN